MNRETINLFVTILTPVLLGLGAYAFNAKLDTVKSDLTGHSDANVAGLKQAITESYETQAAHKGDMDAMTTWNKTLAQGQRDLSDKVDRNNVEQRLAIQHLGDMISVTTKQNQN